MQTFRYPLRQATRQHGKRPPPPCPNQSRLGPAPFGSLPPAACLAASRGVPEPLSEPGPHGAGRKTSWNPSSHFSHVSQASQKSQLRRYPILKQSPIAVAVVVFSGREILLMASENLQQEFAFPTDRATSMEHICLVLLWFTLSSKKTALD